MVEFIVEKQDTGSCSGPEVTRFIEFSEAEQIRRQAGDVTHDTKRYRRAVERVVACLQGAQP
jgi:hypothetical protein